MSTIFSVCFLQGDSDFKILRMNIFLSFTITITCEGITYIMFEKLGFMGILEPFPMF